MNENNRLLFLGLLLIFGGLFFPLYTSCNFNGDIDEITTQYHYGYQSPSYFQSLFFLSLVFLSGVLLKNKVITVFLAVFGAVFSILEFLMSSAFSGLPCGSQISEYQWCVYLGHLMVVSFSIQTAIDSKKKSNKQENKQEV